MSRRSRCAVTAVVLVSAATPALANAGLPMLGVFMPSLLFALVPIILIEGLAIWRGLGSAAWPSLRWSAVANIASTAVGVPVTWAILVGLEGITGSGRFLPVGTSTERGLAVMRQAPWLPPYPDHILEGMVLAAAGVLLIVFYLVSCLVEYMIVRRFCSTASRRRIAAVLLVANGCTYGGWAAIQLWWQSG